MTRYFWIATFSWIDHRGQCIKSYQGPANSDGTLSRADLLQQVQELAAERDGVPMGANVLFFSVEPEMLPGGAQ